MLGLGCKSTWLPTQPSHPTIGHFLLEIHSLMYSESLTVRILGDSSGLQQELSNVEQSISQLHDRITSATQAGQQVGTALGRVANATGPLQQVSNLLSRVTQQARALSQQPITLNVRPAIAALNQLMQVINQVASQLRNLSLGGGGGGGGPAPAPVAPPVGGFDRTGRPFAGGGLVTGPSGIDRVATRLTAGEFVLNRFSVETLGHSFVAQLNQRPESILTDQRTNRPLPSPPTADPAARTRIASAVGLNSDSSSVIQQRSETNYQTINHFGGISVQLQQSLDLPDLLSSLESQQIALRNRRG